MWLLYNNYISALRYDYETKKRSTEYPTERSFINENALYCREGNRPRRRNSPRT